MPQRQPLLVWRGWRVWSLLAWPWHLHEKLLQLSDVIIHGGQRWAWMLFALFDEIPKADVIHELNTRNQSYINRLQTPEAKSTQEQLVTRMFPSELSCFRGRSGSARVPSGKAWRYKHFPPKGHEPRPWSKYLQAFLLQRHSHQRSMAYMKWAWHRQEAYLTPDLKSSIRWSFSSWSSTQYTEGITNSETTRHSGQDLMCRVKQWSKHANLSRLQYTLQFWKADEAMSDYLEPRLYLDRQLEWDPEPIRIGQDHIKPLMQQKPDDGPCLKM